MYRRLAPGQQSWENGAIKPTKRPQTAEEILEEMRLEAQLAKLDVAEDLAQIHDSEAIAVIRDRLAERYERFTGIHPDERHDFPGSLQ